MKTIQTGWLGFVLLFGFISCASEEQVPKKNEAIHVPAKTKHVKPLKKPIVQLQAKSKSFVQAPFLWKITHDKGDSYLFGTIHASVTPDEVVNDALYEKIDDSTIVVFEADTKAMREDPEAITANLQLEETQSLKKLLGPDDWKQLRRRLRMYPESTLERLRPWVATQLIIDAEIRKLGLSLDRGMDDTLRRYAELQSREIGFLEGFKEGLTDLESAVSVKILRESINENSTQTEFLTLRDRYLSGDDKALAEEFDLIGSSDSRFVNEVLRGRNQKWMKYLVPFLNGGRAFVAVGAAHLIGDDNLIDLLRKEGFKVDRVKSM